MRQIVLDTETTGLEPADGHRIIEIGCVEIRERRITGNDWHFYLNPERDIDEGALEVHGINADFLADKPIFADVVDDFLAYIDGAQLVIHNAPFDVGFLDHELRRLDRGLACIAERCDILDTLKMARQRYPGQKNSQDALCRRLGIDHSHRELHGALLDAKLLAEVYLVMTGGQARLSLGQDRDSGSGTDTREAETLRRLGEERTPLPVIRADDRELKRHREGLEAVARVHGDRSLWEQLEATGQE